MLTRKVLVFITFLILVCSMAANAESRIVLSAKVIRIEPWMPIKITCGVAMVTRLAEYEVNAVYRGHVDSHRVIVSHLACNGDELDDLKIGDDVLLVVRTLRVPERHVWHAWPRDNGPELQVRFSAVEVAKRIYPTLPAH